MTSLLIAGFLLALIAFRGATLIRRYPEQSTTLDFMLVIAAALFGGLLCVLNLLMFWGGHW